MTHRFFAGAGGRNGVNYIPSVDAVEEFKVKTSKLLADNAARPATPSTPTIKSGTNAYHGALFEFLPTTLFDAKQLHFQLRRRPHSKFRRTSSVEHRRPIRFPHYNGHDRSFFFFDYQGTELRQADSSASSMSLLPHIGKAISQAPRPNLRPRDARPRPNGVSHRNLSRNIIPQSRINPTVQKYQALYRLANVGGVESVPETTSPFRQPDEP